MLYVSLQDSVVLNIGDMLRILFACCILYR